MNIDVEFLLYKSHFKHFAGKLLSRWEATYIVKEVYHFEAIKINNAKGHKPKVVNEQTLKHYIVGNPIHIDSDVIQLTRPEECIEETIREAYRTRKIELVRGAVSRQIFKILK